MGIAASPYPLLLLLAALAPFGLGVLLALASGFPPRGPALALEILTITALFLAGWAGREAYVPHLGPWPEPHGWSPANWQRLACVCLALGGIMALLLQVVWQTGEFTVPLAALGIAGGYFIFAPPLAWRRRGWGEFWAGLSFGLLPVLTGFYLQSRHLVSEILLYGLPLSLAAFNLFLVLGFPAPGQEAQRLSLAARLTPAGAGLVYTIINILVIACLVFNLFFPAAGHWSRFWLWALILLAVVNQEMIKRRAYSEVARLHFLGCLTLALHLGMSVVFALGLWGRL
jgi:1,4-dihydroxy-2-naphthoate octaprenyltransferase